MTQSKANSDKVADNIRFNPKANRLGKYFIFVWQNLLIYSVRLFIPLQQHSQSIGCLCFMHISIWYGNCRPCSQWSNLNAVILSRKQNLIANSGLPLWIIFLLLWHSLCLAKLLILFSFGMHTFWSGWCWSLWMIHFCPPKKELFLALRFYVFICFHIVFGFCCAYSSQDGWAFHLVFNHRQIE